MTARLNRLPKSQSLFDTPEARAVIWQWGDILSTSSDVTFQ
jgi:hypothetical protein